MESARLRYAVDVAPDCVAFIVGEMWSTIVLNLLSNAFKFTLEGEIRVSLRPSGTSLALVVEDTGSGISADELPHIFERFHRAPETRSRSHEGSGIGLARVRELVGAHGGEVIVRSEPGRGSTFTVTLPTGTAHLGPRGIFVVMLAARADEESAIEGLEHGADDYVIKAFSAPELLARVRTTIALAHLRRDYEREHRVANLFQRASLPLDLPSVPGSSFDAVYVPGRSDERVGGHWYDAVRLLDGRVVISIGDVAGPDIALHAHPALALRQAVLAEATTEDDIAILTVRIDPYVAASNDATPPLLQRWTFAVSDVVAAQRTRRAFGEELRTRGASAEDVYNAELVLGELISNIVRYAPGDVEIAVDWSGTLPVLHVSDTGSGFRHIALLPNDPYSESGRGLFLVATLTEDVNVRRRAGGGSHTCAVLSLARNRLANVARSDTSGLFLDALSRTY